jgi:ferredoxin-NADP reductase
MQANTFVITLEEAYMISPNVKHFVFNIPTDIEFHYEPGQFITIYFQHEGQTLHRSYSIANPPQKNHQLEFAAGFIKHGPGTEFLFHLKPGDTVETKGPFGRLILKDTSPKRYILVSTSTGVTPYRAMLSNIDQLLHEDPALEIILLHGVQTRADLIYDHEFLAFAAKHQRFQYKPCLSRQKDDLNKHEYSGYVQHALPKLDLKPLEDIVYLCGNPGMVDEAFQWLKDHEFPVQHIVREKYISR